MYFKLQKCASFLDKIANKHAERKNSVFEILHFVISAQLKLVESAQHLDYPETTSVTGNNNHRRNQQTTIWNEYLFLDNLLSLLRWVNLICG